MAAGQLASGRARTVLVFGAGDDAGAAVSTIVVRLRSRTARRQARFTGPVLFEPSTARHIEHVILPIVDRITDGLGLPRRTFEISVANLAGASVADLGVKVSGFSADVPVLLAMLSACLQIPIPQDLVSTGHLASADGDIRIVSYLPAKLAAAAADSSIRRLVYPSLGRDLSLEALSPEDRQLAGDALANAPAHLRTIGVGDLAELLPVVFDEAALVLAGLRRGFFGLSPESWEGADPVSRSLTYLVSRSEDRFWTAMEHHLLAGGIDRARSLLRARAQFEAGRRNYPPALGHRLLRLVLSLPPASRRVQGLFPLLEMGRCLELGRFAGPAEHEDVRELIEAATGKGVKYAPRVEPEALPGVSNAAFESVRSQISAEFLAREIGLPIDSARLSYLIQSPTAASYDEFREIVYAFYLHLQRHTHDGVVSADAGAVGAEAMALVGRAFAWRGGWDAAWAEARDGTSGGVRAVLDLTTDQYKNEAKAQHVQQVLKLALDPLAWDERVAMITALLREIGPALPAELRSSPPARFARGWEILVHAYVESVDQVKAILKRF